MRVVSTSGRRTFAAAYTVAIRSSALQSVLLSASDIDRLEIRTLLQKLEDLPECLDPDMHSVFFISHNRLLKCYPSFEEANAEMLSLDLVRSQTTVPVPRIRKVFKTPGYTRGNALALMDVIPRATQLKRCWPSLPLWQKLKLVLTMRFYLRQIRRVRSPAHSSSPGPLGMRPQVCQGLQFVDELWWPAMGPMTFDTYADLADHFDRWRIHVLHLVSIGWASVLPGLGPPLPTEHFSTLMFTHNDLNTRNILLDDDGKLWIVDWAWAGFYPRWFEYTGMRLAFLKGDDAKDWQHAVRFMTEPAFDVEAWLHGVSIYYD
jgi:hypothetical protein